VNVTIRYSFLPSNPNQELTASRNRQNRLLPTPPARTSKNPTFSTLLIPFHFPIPRGVQLEMLPPAALGPWSHGSRGAGADPA
jgi:hypothetical protein